MTIQEYIKEYTAGNRIVLGNVFSEIWELLAEIIKLNKKGIKEEWGDVFHFMQLWCYWRWGVNGKIWEVSRSSVDKFMQRKKVWNQIYLKVGLPENISGYAGNYKKLEKVVAHLGRLGVGEKEAKKVYGEVVTG